jgi:hypothetical protein
MSHRVDRTSAVDIGIDYAHVEAHVGSHYFATFIDTDFDVETHYITIVVPATAKWPHLVFTVESSAFLDASLQEGAVPNPAALGTPMAVYNNNRNSAQVSQLTLRSDDAFTGAGTTIWSYAGGTTGSVGSPIAARAGGETRVDSEFILKSNTTYRLTMTGGKTNERLAVLLEWYEHTNYTGLGAIT